MPPGFCAEGLLRNAGQSCIAAKRMIVRRRGSVLPCTVLTGVRRGMPAFDEELYTWGIREFVDVTTVVVA